VMTMIPRLRSEYYVLPKDDPLRAVNMLRAAAGLAPLIDGGDALPEQGVTDDRSSEAN
jgi:hypothetical protein